MWTDISLANRDALLQELDRYRAGLEQLRQMLDAGDGERLAERFGAARAAHALASIHAQGLKMDDKVVLITGASRGIGAATARLAAAEAWRVAVNYRKDLAGAEAVVAELRRAGADAGRFAQMSLEADIVGLFDAVAERFGRIDALVNNAGVTAPIGRLEDYSAQRVEQVLRSNVLGPILCCREAVRRMSTRHGGSGGAIVNVSSAASRLGSAGEYIDYAASKGAIDTLTLGLAREVAAEGIRVNAVRRG